MGLSVKQCLSMMSDYTEFSSNKHNYLLKQLENGQSLYSIFNELLYPKQSFRIHLKNTSLELEPWLKQHINFIEKKQHHSKPLQQKLLYSSSVLAFSLLLFFYLSTSYLSNIDSLFQGKNAQMPSWLTYTQQFSQFVTHFWYYLIGIFATIFILVKKYSSLFRRLFTFSHHTQLSELAHLISQLLKQGIDIRDIAESLEVSKFHNLAPALGQFKEQILIKHDGNAAFNALFQRPFIASILHHSIQSNRLSEGLDFVSQYFEDIQLKRTQCISKAMLFSGTMLSAVFIVGGFYISILPLTTLIRSIE
jgi:type II secretory pathway component PulF